MTLDGEPPYPQNCALTRGYLLFIESELENNAGVYDAIDLANIKKMCDRLSKRVHDLQVRREYL